MYVMHMWNEDIDIYKAFWNIVLVLVLTGF